MRQTEAPHEEEQNYWRHLWQVTKQYGCSQNREKNELVSKLELWLWVMSCVYIVHFVWNGFLLWIMVSHLIVLWPAWLSFVLTADLLLSNYCLHHQCIDLCYLCGMLHQFDVAFTLNDGLWIILYHWRSLFFPFLVIADGTRSEAFWIFPFPLFFFFHLFWMGQAWFTFLYLVGKARIIVKICSGLSP